MHDSFKKKSRGEMTILAIKVNLIFLAKSGWRKKNKESKFKNMKPTVKYSGESMLVCET